MEEVKETSTRPRVQRLWESLGFLVNGLARLMKISLENRLRPIGLTPNTWSVLMALGEEDHLNQTDISHRTFLDGATTTRALDLLEARGFIERNRDDSDRRVQIVALTEAGQEVYHDTAVFGTSVNEEATSELSAGEREQLEALVARVVFWMQNQQNSEGNSGR